MAVYDRWDDTPMSMFVIVSIVVKKFQSINPSGP